MKILIESYNKIMQTNSGGVPMRINKLIKYSEKKTNIKLFDKWSDKIEDYDLLHVFKANIDDAILIKYAKLHGKKIVVSSVIEQDNRIKIIFSLLLKHIFKVNSAISLLASNLNNADIIIAQTKKEANYINKYYKISLEKIKIIPNGVNENLINLKIDNNTKKDIVLCVGRFNENKNQLSLIKAMKNSDIPVHFIGGAIAEEIEYYDKCIQEAKGSQNIYFHGWLNANDDEFINLFKRTKVMVLISHYEIFGNALIEGAACGANLVASSVLPLSEWNLDKYCEFVDSNNIDSIGKAVKKQFYKENDLTIREIIKQEFSWENIINRYIKIYEDLLKEKNHD